jgi:Leucine rich repeat
LFFVIGVIFTCVTKAENSSIVPNIQLQKFLIGAQELRLTFKGIEQICSGAFVGFDRLTKLDLSWNELTVLSKDLFRPLLNIKEIFLRFNELTSISFNDFANNRKLETLVLTNNKISTIVPINNGERFIIINLYIDFNKLVNVSELCKFTKLEELYLSSNENLDYSIFKPCCWSELRKLTLSNTGLKKLNNDYRLFTGLTKLEELFMANNNLEVFCVGTFPELPTLKELSITQNGLEHLDVFVLHIKFPNLRIMFLSDNSWNCDYFKPMESNLKIIEIETDGNCANGITIPKPRPVNDVCKKIEYQLTTTKLLSTTPTYLDSDTPGGENKSINLFNSFTTTTNTNKPTENPHYQNTVLELYLHFACQFGITIALFLIDTFLSIFFSACK